MDHEAVFWDVGGVILDIGSISQAQREFVGRLVSEYDLDVTPDEARTVWRDALREHFAGREGDEYRTAREGRRKAAAALFEGDPPADWEDRYRETTAGATGLTPGVEATMRTLDDAGLYQAIISDADDGLRDRIDSLGLGEYVDDVTTSEEVGYVKPHPAPFERAFEKARAAGVDPERGIMVGDKYENDMEGGSAMGLTTVAHGAEDGPAVDHRIEEIDELLSIVGVEERREAD